MSGGGVGEVVFFDGLEVGELESAGGEVVALDAGEVGAFDGLGAVEDLAVGTGFSEDGVEDIGVEGEGLEDIFEGHFHNERE